MYGSEVQEANKTQTAAMECWEELNIIFDCLSRTCSQGGHGIGIVITFTLWSVLTFPEPTTQKYAGHLFCVNGMLTCRDNITVSLSNHSGNLHDYM